jgi:threonine synthase
MLYVTTRDKFDAYTVARVLCENRGDDNGYFIPMNMPDFSPDELLNMVEKGFSHAVAEMLNLFFATKLTSWDVEFCIGRHPVKLEKQKQQIYFAELWHNLDHRYDRLEKTLMKRLNEKSWQLCPEGWLKIGVRIAVIFGMYAELIHGGFDPESSFDIALTDKDFSWLMAFWYARVMGLPMGKIIVACTDSSQLWDFLRSGHAALGGNNSLPEEMERLLSCEFGSFEANSFAMAYSEKDVYTLSEENYDTLREKMFVSVVSKTRCNQIIPNVYNTIGYVLTMEAAAAFSAVQDDRARNGGMRPVLLLCRENPIWDAAGVSGAMEISQGQLKEILGVH